MESVPRGSPLERSAPIIVAVRLESATRILKQTDIARTSPEALLVRTEMRAPPPTSAKVASVVVIAAPTQRSAKLPWHREQLAPTIASVGLVCATTRGTVRSPLALGLLHTIGIVTPTVTVRVASVQVTTYVGHPMDNAVCVP